MCIRMCASAALSIDIRRSVVTVAVATEIPQTEGIWTLYIYMYILTQFTYITRKKNEKEEEEKTQFKPNTGYTVHNAQSSFAYVIQA